MRGWREGGGEGAEEFQESEAIDKTGLMGTDFMNKLLCCLVQTQTPKRSFGVFLETSFHIPNPIKMPPYPESLRLFVSHAQDFSRLPGRRLQRVSRRPGKAGETASFGSDRSCQPIGIEDSMCCYQGKPVCPNS